MLAAIILVLPPLLPTLPFLSLPFLVLSLFFTLFLDSWKLDLLLFFYPRGTRTPPLASQPPNSPRIVPTSPPKPQMLCPLRWFSNQDFPFESPYPTSFLNKWEWLGT